MTLSVLALDPEAGLIGVASVTHSLAVGARVTWAEPGVGVTVTQSVTEPRHGPAVLAALRRRESAAEALQSVLAGDPGARWRQLGVLDRSGAAAVHDGDLSFGERCGLAEPGFAVVGNMLARDTTADAVRAAFHAAAGTLGERLTESLRAGDVFGGDRRTIRSASLLVAAADPPAGASPPPLSLRVDDHPEPLRQLSALLAASRLQEAVGAFYGEITSGAEQLGLHEVRAAVEHAQTEGGPYAGDVLFWGAMVLLRRGHAAEARRRYAQAVGHDPCWRDFLRMVVDRRLVPADAVAGPENRSDGQQR